MKYRNIMNISLQQIQIFLKCCRYLNFSRVAEEYNFTPSMISKTIKSLEDLLGIPLFCPEIPPSGPDPGGKGTGKRMGIHLPDTGRNRHQSL